MDNQLIRITNEALGQYYDSEKNALPIVISAAVFVLAVGVALLKQNQLVAKGIGAAILIASLIVAIGAIIYAFQIGPQKAIYTSLLYQDPPNFCTKEMAHLNKMQDNFRNIIGTDLVIAALGIGLVILGNSQRKEFMKGFGIGLVAMFVLLACLENYNRMRSLRYREKVETLQKHLAFEV